MFHHRQERQPILGAGKCGPFVGENDVGQPGAARTQRQCNLIGVRARYGHGGFPGFDREWRVRREHSGGGVLIDVGVHLIDLSRYFLGEITEVLGSCQTLYWKIPVEDYGYLTLKAGTGKIAFLHASWTDWKPLFSFEVSGALGSIEVSGLGRKYGKERLIHYEKSAASPENCGVYEFAEDDSWEIEIKEFLKDISLGRDPVPGLSDAKAALRVVRSVYGREAAAADH